MIESKILGEAVGIQYQGEKDLSETSAPNRLTKATFVGKFRRGVMGRPFKVTPTTHLPTAHDNQTTQQANPNLSSHHRSISTLATFTLANNCTTLPPSQTAPFFNKIG